MVYVDKDDVKFALYDLVTLVAENAEMGQEHGSAFAIRDEPRRLREVAMRKEDARSWKVRELWKEARERGGLAAEDERAREFDELNLMNAEDRRSREWSVMYGFDYVYENPDWWYAAVVEEVVVAEVGVEGAQEQGWEQGGWAGDEQHYAYGGESDAATGYSASYDESGAAYETKDDEYYAGGDNGYDGGAEEWATEQGGGGQSYDDY